MNDPVRYPAATGGTTAAIGIGSVSVLVGTLAWIADGDPPAWLAGIVLVVVLGTLGWSVLWALRAGVTVEREGLGIAGAIGDRLIEWRTIGAVDGGHQVAVLVDGDWIGLPATADVAAQYRTVVARWQSRRGALWQPPASAPPAPSARAEQVRAQMAAAEARPREPLTGWWALPAWLVIMPGGVIWVPLVFAISPSVGLTIACAAFTAMGLISVVAGVGGALRRREQVPGWRLAVAVAVLVAGAAATAAAAMLLP